MRSLLSLLVPAVLVGLLVGCGDDGDDDGEGRKRPPTPVSVVEVISVGTGDVADLLLASASVEAERSADLMPNATGRVVSLHADVGDTVRRGALLAVLENVSLDAGAERAEAEVSQLEARVREMEALFQQGAVSSRELEDLRYQLRTARTGLREATQTAGETRLTAPFAGVVASREIRIGELATSAVRAFQVVDLGDLRVRARLPERDVSRVAVGQRARLVSAYDDSRTAMASVTRISPVIDAATGTFEVVLVLDDGQDALRPGQFVSIELRVDVHEDVVVVPKDAVVYDNGAPVVFRYVLAPPEEEEDDAVADDDDDAAAADEEATDAEDADEAPEDAGPAYVARRTPVVVGLTDTRNAEITEGLSVDDLVVVVGQTALRDGARIRVPDAPEGTAARDAGPSTDDEG